MRSRIDLLYSVIRAQSWSRNSAFSATRSIRAKPTCQPPHLSNLIQVASDRSVVNAELLENLSCCFKRIIFDDCLLLVVVIIKRADKTFLIIEVHIATAIPIHPSPHRAFVDIMF